MGFICFSLVRSLSAKIILSTTFAEVSLSAIPP